MSTIAADIKAKFKKVISDFDSDKVGIVATKDLLVKTALESGLAYKLQLPAKFVGVHPTNRNGEGLEANRVHSRGALILQAGWSWAAIDSNSIAIEDCPVKKHVARFTCDLCGLSEKFAAYKPEEVKVGSLGAGHANHWLACVAEGVPCSTPGISEEGKMSAALCCQDLGVKEAVEKGLRWTILRHEVESEFPMVPNIIQGALNAQASAHEGANFVQTLLQVVDEAKSFTKGNTVKWSEVAKKVARAQPARAGDVPSIIEFVKIWGGLPSGSFVRELNEVAKVFVPSERLISPMVFKVLGSLRFSPKEHPAHFVNAAIFTHAASKEGVQDNYARFISKGEFESFATKLRPSVLQANEFLVRANKLMDASSLPRTEKLQAIGKLKQQIVKSVLGRLTPAMTLEEVVSEFSKDITGGGVPAAAPPSDIESTSSSSTATNVVHYDGEQAVGVARMTLINKGFKVDNMVALRQSPWSISKIVAISDDGVVSLAEALEDGSFSDEIEKRELDDFIDHFKSCKAHFELLQGWPGNDGRSHADVEQLMCKSIANMALLAAIKEFPTPPLRITNKPTRKVLTTKAYTIGSISLPPVSTFISAVDDPATTSNPLVKVGEAVYQVKPTVRADFVGALFCLKTTNTKEDANMAYEVHQVKVKPPTSKTAVQVEVQVAKNFKKVDIGEELVLYREKVETPKAPKRALAVIGQDSKKQKV